MSPNATQPFGCLFCDSTLSLDGLYDEESKQREPTTWPTFATLGLTNPHPDVGTVTSRDEFQGNVPRTTANLWVNKGVGLNRGEPV